MSLKNLTMIIGIDPDVDGSGVAFLDMKTHEMKVENLSLAELCTLFAGIANLIHHPDIAEDAKRYVIVVEAGYLNKTNWHTVGVSWRVKNATNAAAETGRRTGRNHQIAMDIVELAKHYYHLPVIERRPLIKAWSGPDRKITHEEFVQVTGCKQGRTNQDQRDAGLLAWYESGLPIRVKVGK